jgi:hypothetical protein
MRIPVSSLRQMKPFTAGCHVPAAGLCKHCCSTRAVSLQVKVLLLVVAAPPLFWLGAYRVPETSGSPMQMRTNCVQTFNACCLPAGCDVHATLGWDLPAAKRQRHSLSTLLAPASAMSAEGLLLHS